MSQCKLHASCNALRRGVAQSGGKNRVKFKIQLMMLKVIKEWFGWHSDCLFVEKVSSFIILSLLLFSFYGHWCANRIDFTMYFTAHLHIWRCLGKDFEFKGYCCAFSEPKMFESYCRMVLMALRLVFFVKKVSSFIILSLLLFSSYQQGRRKVSDIGWA